MTASERKVLLACGAGVRMSATFNTPIAGVILAIELLLFEFRSRSFIPLVVASTLATATRFVVMGRSAMFEIGNVDFGVDSNLLYYLLLGVICGFAAVGFSRALYWVEDRFERLPIAEFWWPAIGGLALGIIGYFMPRAFGVGYDTISGILNDKFTLGLLLGIMVFKAASAARRAGVRDLWRVAVPHVYDERGDGRRLHEVEYSHSRGASGSRRVCPAGHGGGIRGGARMRRSPSSSLPLRSPATTTRYYRSC
jgi:Voltage gated chloride channel